MRFARNVFFGAAVYGFIVLLPQYFMETRIGRDYPPPITHPENFYGFIGTALACQILFLVIARDPERFRPAMVAAVVEKFSFGGAVAVLFAQHRVPSVTLVFALIDTCLGLLFIAAYLKTSPAAPART